MRQKLAAWMVLGLALGCGPANEAGEPRPPRVRVFEVSEASSGQVRMVSGQLAPAKSSPLAFGVAGTIDSVLIDQGDPIEEGQLLASLDAQPLRLSLEQARSELKSNRATFVESESAYERAARLERRGVMARAQVEVAEANLKSARANLRGSQSRVEQAERDLRRAELRAPFTGVVTERSVDPFQEISANEAAFVVQAEGALLVKVRVAEAVIRDVDYAQAVRVTFPSLPGFELVGVVSLIAAQAGAGNAFPVEVQLPDSEADLRSGMTARVSFNFDEYLDGRTAYLVPLSAIAIDVGLLGGGSSQEGEAPLFLLDEETSRVEVRNVRIGGLRGNELEVFEGLEAGDLVVSAGVPFLQDGMEVRRWSPEAGLGGG